MLRFPRRGGGAVLHDHDVPYAASKCRPRGAKAPVVFEAESWPSHRSVLQLASRSRSELGDSRRQVVGSYAAAADEEDAEWRRVRADAGLRGAREKRRRKQRAEETDPLMDRSYIGWKSWAGTDFDREGTLSDPQVARELRLVDPNLLDETLGVLAPDECLQLDSEREVGREGVIDDRVNGHDARRIRVSAVSLQRLGDGSDLCLDLGRTQRISTLDRNERRGLAPAISEEDLGCANLVGGTGRLTARTLTPRNREQSLDKLCRIASVGLSHSFAIPFGRPEGLPLCPGIKPRPVTPPSCVVSPLLLTSSMPSSIAAGAVVAGV